MTVGRSAAEVPGNRVHIASQLEIEVGEPVSTVCGQSHSHFSVDIAPLGVMVHPVGSDRDRGGRRRERSRYAPCSRHLTDTAARPFCRNPGTGAAR